MNFDTAMGIVAQAVSATGCTIRTQDYDGIIVKKLESSNTLDSGRTTNQTHIAITGDQMDIFPYLRADGYFSVPYAQKDDELKKYFLTQIPVILKKANIDTFDPSAITFTATNEKCVMVSIVRSRRKEQTDQIQMSMLDSDSEDFVIFRRLLHTGDYIIILKRRERLEFEFYGVKSSVVETLTVNLPSLNNLFFKLPTKTKTSVTGVRSDFIPNVNRKLGGANYLLYGVPGSGKSHTVKTDYCPDEARMERVVFHPDYTYSDFVGQIMPKLDDRLVYYDFVPGPFTLMLEKAYNNPEQEFFLVIEELNRGNAPAIFGEVFQLLDRKEDGERVGESSYGITNAAVASIVYKNPDHPVYIPSNLNIVATMNTSDQNVFTLDTAFQRRWRMRMIENNIEKAVHANDMILDTTVTWAEFNKAINRLILEANSRLSSSEDKRLGAYFVTASDLLFVDGDDRQNSRFPEKVLKYLWDDAFKFSREVLFDVDSYPSLEDVIRTFKTSKGNDRFIKIFKEGVLGNLDSNV